MEKTILTATNNRSVLKKEKLKSQKWTKIVAMYWLAVNYIYDMKLKLPSMYVYIMYMYTVWNMGDRKVVRGGWWKDKWVKVS